MSIKDIQEAMTKGKVVFGLKQTLKNLKDKKKTKMRIFVTSDARSETLKNLADSKADFEKIRAREEVAKDLGLDFECEVISIL